MFKSKLKFSLLAGILSGIMLLGAGAFADSGQGIPSNLPKPYPWSSSASNFMYNEFVANPNMCIVSCVESGKTDVYYFDKTWQSGFVALPTTDVQALSATWDLSAGLGQFDVLDNSELYTYIPGSSSWANNGDLQTLSVNDLDASGTNPWLEDSDIIQIYRTTGYYITALINNQDGKGDAIYITYVNGPKGWTNWTNTNCITGDIAYFSNYWSSSCNAPAITVYDYYGNPFAKLNPANFTWAYDDEATTISYVSPIPKDSSNAVYRITIPTESIFYYLDASQSVGNALTYDISFNNGKAYLEYPLSGFLFDGNYSREEEAYSRPMSFEVVGPVSSSSSSSTYSTDAYDYDFSKATPAKNTISSTSSVSIPLNDNTFNQNLPSNLNISTTQITSYEYTNGTCAIPFLVSLTYNDASGNTVTLPADNYLYNHLVFYVQNGNADNIVGANPNNPLTDYYGVVPAEYAEAAPGYVKYGVSGSSLETYSNGRVYYLYSGSGASGAALNVGLYSNGSYLTPAQLSPTPIDPNIYPTSAASTQSSAIQIFTLTGFNLQAHSQSNLYASDPYALNNNTNYLSPVAAYCNESSPYDLILPDYTFDTYKGIYGIYAVSPYSGLSTDQLNQRYQWLNNLADCSYRIQPMNYGGISNVNPLVKDNLVWQSAAYCTTNSELGPQLYQITNFNQTTAGKHLYDYMFSQYGTYYAYSYIDTNSLSSEFPMAAYAYTNSSNLPDIVTSAYTLPSGQIYQSGIPYYFGLMIMPGKSVSYLLPTSGGTAASIVEHCAWWTDNSLGQSKALV